jgi:hypothetical protein
MPSRRPRVQPRAGLRQTRVPVRMRGAGTEYRILTESLPAKPKPSGDSRPLSGVKNLSHQEELPRLHLIPTCQPIQIHS